MPSIGSLTNLVFTDDKERGFKTFKKCVSYYKKLANEPNANITLDEIFEIKYIPDQGGERSRYTPDKFTMANLETELIANIEEKFECAGMCKKSLFYFGRDITKYPKPPS